MNLQNCNGAKLVQHRNVDVVERREQKLEVIYFCKERLQLATQVWQKVAVWFPGLPRWNFAVANLEARIRFWHRRLCRSDKPHASTVIPCLILWFLWSERNNNIHRGTLFSAEIVFNRIKSYLQNLISAGKLLKFQWKGCGNVEDFNTNSWREAPCKQIRQVRWIPPDANWIKLNTAGVWKGAEAGGGGGNIQWGFAAKVVATSVLDVALQALSLGLDNAREQQKSVWIELESKEVVSLLQHGRYSATESLVSKTSSDFWMPRSHIYLHRETKLQTFQLNKEAEG